MPKRVTVFPRNRSSTGNEVLKGIASFGQGFLQSLQLKQERAKQQEEFDLQKKKFGIEQRKQELLEKEKQFNSIQDLLKLQLQQRSLRSFENAGTNGQQVPQTGGIDFNAIQQQFPKLLQGFPTTQAPAPVTPPQVTPPPSPPDESFFFNPRAPITQDGQVIEQRSQAPSPTPDVSNIGRILQPSTTFDPGGVEVTGPPATAATETGGTALGTPTIRQGGEVTLPLTKTVEDPLNSDDFRSFVAAEEKKSGRIPEDLSLTQFGLTRKKTVGKPPSEKLSATRILRRAKGLSAGEINGASLARSLQGTAFRNNPDIVKVIDRDFKKRVNQSILAKVNTLKQVLPNLILTQNQSSRLLNEAVRDTSEAFDGHVPENFKTNILGEPPTTPAVSNRVVEGIEALGRDSQDPASYNPVVLGAVRDQINAEELARSSAQGAEAARIQLQTKQQTPLSPSELVSLVLPDGSSLPFGTTLQEAQQLGAIPISQSAQAQLSKIQSSDAALETLENLSNKIFKDTGFFDRVFASARNIRHKLLQDNPDIVLYLGLKEALPALVLRGLGEAGTLTDRDIERINSAFPVVFPLPDTPEVATAKLGSLRGIIAEIRERSISGAASSSTTTQKGLTPAEQEEMKSLEAELGNP